mmetsp:Transcript_14998/g.34887  ORF Transcript_14998/g.34887 Transcript_14998/m.34887 type:complete len:315 (-) Transcript_14998:464-1408(-)
MDQGPQYFSWPPTVLPIFLPCGTSFSTVGPFPTELIFSTERIFSDSGSLVHILPSDSGILVPLGLMPSPSASPLIALLSSVVGFLAMAGIRIEEGSFHGMLVGAETELISSVWFAAKVRRPRVGCALSEAISRCMSSLLFSIARSTTYTHGESYVSSGKFVLLSGMSCNAVLEVIVRRQAGNLSMIVYTVCVFSSVVVVVPAIVTASLPTVASVATFADFQHQYSGQKSHVKHVGHLKHMMHQLQSNPQTGSSQQHSPSSAAEPALASTPGMKVLFVVTVLKATGPATTLRKPPSKTSIVNPSCPSWRYPGPVS